MKSFLGKELGRGGYGIVYEKIDDPAIAIKVSNKTANNSCRIWSNEYSKIKEIVKNIENHKSYKKLTMVELLNPINFHDSSSICYMLMPRVYRPDEKRSRTNNSSIIKKNIDKPYYTLHTLFGKDTLRKHFLGRGEFIGLREIEEYLSKETIEQMAYQLGILLGLIHFVAKNDACDIEIYLGRDATSKKLKLFMGDFDKVSDIEDFKDYSIDHLVWCMESVEYFPKKEANNELYQLFKNGYLSITGTDIEYVHKLFNKYEEY